ncbi:MAG: hypothetical protein J0L88_04260 [Xanthomonadales bacterium]|nr:hypothetical protein [Xanthomonadales bacterium]
MTRPAHPPAAPAASEAFAPVHRYADAGGPFDRFIAARLSDLKRIARATRGEHRLEDVVNEAWLMAVDVAAKHKLALDLSDAAFQNRLIAHLYQALVRYTDLHVRRAERLDHGTPDGHGEDRRNPRSGHLVADGGTGPLHRLLEVEARDTSATAGHRVRGSLGEAWIALFDRFRSMRRIAECLLISVSHAYRCCARVREVTMQQSPFCMHAQDAPPQVGPWRRFRSERIPRQLEFDFAERLPLREGGHAPGSGDQRGA